MGKLITSYMAFLNQDELTKRWKVGVHGITRAEFDSLPGKAKLLVESPSPVWVKDVNSVITVFTMEPPVEKK